jgi:hypothetical protein
MLNDQKIEQLLRQAPQPPMPPGLPERLQAEIRLPQAQVRESGFSWFTLPRFRWAPALSCALALLLSLGLLARQSAELARLHHEKEKLQTAQAQFEELRREFGEVQALQQAQREVQRLRLEHEELLRLRAEAAEILALLARIETLQAENRSLKEQWAALVPPLPPLDSALLEEAQEKAERIKCVSHLKNIGLAARIWATDNVNFLPADYLSMKNELSTPRLLICPGDHARQAAENWSQFGAAHSSYELLSPGISETEPQVVYARCPIHNNAAMVDGSVQQLGPQREIVFENGRWQLQRLP